MPDLVRALAISGGILLLVVVLTVFVSIAAVNRGAANMGEEAHRHREDELPVAKETAAAAPAAKGGKPAVAASDEISVIQILLFGVGLFTVTVLALLALSFLQHVR